MIMSYSQKERARVLTCTSRFFHQSNLLGVGVHALKHCASNFANETRTGDVVGMYVITFEALAMAAQIELSPCGVYIQ